MGLIAKAIKREKQADAVIHSINTGERKARSDIYRASRDRSRARSAVPSVQSVVPGRRGAVGRLTSPLRKLNNFNMPGNGLGVPNGIPGGGTGGLGSIMHPRLLGMGKHRKVTKTTLMPMQHNTFGHAAKIAKQQKMNLPTSYRPLSKQPYGLG